MYNEPEPTNPVSFDYNSRFAKQETSPIHLWITVWFHTYLYIDTWSWSSSVARSVILIPFRLTAKETLCNFFPLAFAYDIKITRFHFYRLREEFNFVRVREMHVPWNSTMCSSVRNSRDERLELLEPGGSNCTGENVSNREVSSSSLKVSYQGRSDPLSTSNISSLLY